MRLPSRRPALRNCLAAALLALIALPADADTAHGVMRVTAIVLPSCEVIAHAGTPSGVAGSGNEGHTESATVNCSAAWPFRASFGYGTATGSVVSGTDLGLVFKGALRVDVSRAARAVYRGVEDEVETLTISY